MKKIDWLLSVCPYNSWNGSDARTYMFSTSRRPRYKPKSANRATVKLQMDLKIFGARVPTQRVDRMMPQSHVWRGTRPINTNPHLGTNPGASMPAMATLFHHFLVQLVVFLHASSADLCPSTVNLSRCKNELLRWRVSRKRYWNECMWNQKHETVSIPLGNLKIEICVVTRLM